MNSLSEFLVPITLELKEIFLDPNNPRFTEADWTYVPEADWDKPDVQEAAQRRLVAEHDVDKLRMSMEVNGYLPIDRVIVKKFDDAKYLVLEGNRRICAAKKIGDIGIDGSTISESVKDSLRDIPCLLYTGTDVDASWVFQGLRHISGVAEWSAFNKAKLLVEQMEKDELTLTAVGKRFGLTSHGAGQWVRGYSAFNQARQNSEYLNEVDERAYPYFQELFGRSCVPLREWLDWDESTFEFKNKLNFAEFISWLYPRPDDGSDEVSTKKGEFEKRRIARRDDLRQLSALLANESDIFQQFRNGLALDNCISISISRILEEEARKKADPILDLFNAISLCEKSILNIPYKAMRDPSTRERIMEGLDQLEKIISEMKN